MTRWPYCGSPSTASAVKICGPGTAPLFTAIRVRPANAFVASPMLSIVRSEEHTSELQSLMRISYAVFCLKKKKKNRWKQTNILHEAATREIKTPQQKQSM